MNEIVMIPVAQLEHHPENPRKDLGDLTELAASIKANGIMQNLTVVPGRTEKIENGTLEKQFYLVVIGNRRLEAAKMAGLEALPCVVASMDPKEQLSTMLMENMQRTDLTVYEQAQGFQMMMDLGLTEEQIGEMTGFSRTTVRRRVKMAELDQEALAKYGTQLTMDDLDKLAKVQDIKKRNELLKEAGSGNFKWKVDNALTEQTRAENYEKIRERLLAAGCIERSTNGIDNFWKEYEYLAYGCRVELDGYTDEKDILPEDDRQLYFSREYSLVRFWAEKRKEEPKEEDEEPDEEEIARQKELEQAREAWARLEEIEKHADESRGSFLRDLTVKQKDNRKALDWMIIALTVSNNMDDWRADLLPEYEDEELAQLPKGHSEVDLDLKYIRTAINESPTLYAETMGSLFFTGEDCVVNKWARGRKPEYCRNITLITGYEWLEDFGYRMSDEERAYLDGTLDCYAEAEEE